MKALTFQEPYATLVCPPAPHRAPKRIETRGLLTKYRGDLLVCAGKSAQMFWDLPGDCEGKTEGGWVYGYVGDFQACYCFEDGGEGKPGDATLTRCEWDGKGPEFHLDLHLGHAVGVVRVAGCLPVVEDSGWTGEHQDELFASFGGQRLRRRTVVAGSLIETDVTDQLPYGLFEPGRYAWLLEDPRPLAEPIPVRGMPGMFTPPDEVVARVREQLG